MKKLLIICGPTATGKTALGIKLAKKFNGELISADSRQVYKGMDVGTGKDLPVNSKFQIPNSKQIPKSKFQIGYYLLEEVPVWLYDVVASNYQFNVAGYVECANLVIEDIWQRDKLPILVGGTGFYIKALIDGVESLGVPPDWELREKLSNCQIVELSNLLKELDFQRWQKMNESDRNNPRRLIRAIEIATRIPNSKIQIPKKNQILKFKIQNVLFLGLKAPYKILYERIDQRVEERVRRGIIKEIKNLLKKGYNFDNSVLGKTIGYKEWKTCFINSKFQIPNSKLKEEIIQKWKYEEHSYARRQMIWFKKDKRIKWFDITEPDWQLKVVDFVKNWYYGN